MTIRTIGELHIEALESRVAPGAVCLDITHTYQGDLVVVAGEKATIARGCIGIVANNVAAIPTFGIASMDSFESAMRNVAQDSGGRYFPVN